ncbi:MAG: hypothetical protein KatS3mg090_0164 [Patescibacteria group bacterium]|nr:MAG: hypothetical protein KatS3mg090_0164 [Patescibacteria group bacterium]
MDDSFSTEKKRGFLSSLALFTHSGYTALLGFVSFFLISYKSSAEVLGIYNTVLASLSFLNYITNLGLPAALITKQKVDDKDLNSVFYFQTFVTSIAIVLGIVFMKKIFPNINQLPAETKYIYLAVLLSFLFFALKTPISVILEKNIQIYKNVLVQGIENTVFYLTVIIFTLYNNPLWGIVAGVLLRSTIGATLLYLFQPWKPKLLFSFKRLKALLRFGLMFQGTSFLALIKDDFWTIYLSRSIGLNNLGYLSFAKKYAEIFIRIVIDNLNRVFFPLFSRNQTDKEKLKYYLTTYLKYATLITFPLIIGAMLIFKDFLLIFPKYYNKWHTALPMFYLFSISSILVIFTSPFINFLNGIGKVNISLRFMFIWTVIMWSGTLFLLSQGTENYIYLPIIFVIIGITSVFVIYVVKKIVKIDIIKSIKTALQASLIMIATFFITKTLLNYMSLNQLTVAVVLAVVSASSYLATVLVLETQEIITRFLSLLKNDNKINQS